MLPTGELLASKSKSILNSLMYILNSSTASLNPANQIFNEITGIGDEATRLTFGEDCLSVNVWTPKPIKKGPQRLAVLVWVYGGASQYVYSLFPLTAALIDELS